ncbi:MAG: pyrroline-5-carboxylate reductase [Rhodospirillales bacterium]
MADPSGSKVLLAGCGKMGGALLQGWLARGFSPANIAAVDPAPAGPLPAGVKAVKTPAELDPAFAPDAVVLAVKPQVMDAALLGYAGFAQAGALTLSIAAGKTVACFEAAFGGTAPIVRAMPNTPAAAGRGVTALCANAHVDGAGRALTESLMQAVGETVWLDDENLMDAVTAVSGSGPAYVFLLAESLAAAGEKAGLPADLAAQLARATITGAGALLDAAAETPPATLRENVTSPGGTTAAALAVLMGEDGWQAALDEAVKAATERSRELAG